MPRVGEVPGGLRQYVAVDGQRPRALVAAGEHDRVGRTDDSGCVQLEAVGGRYDVVDLSDSHGQAVVGDRGQAVLQVRGVLHARKEARRVDVATGARV